MRLAGGFRSEYAHEIHLTDRVLEQSRTLPADWRPHSRSRSAGALSASLADVPLWGAHILDRAVCDILTLPGPSLAVNHELTLERFWRQADAT